jgi:ribosomal protein L19E
MFATTVLMTRAGKGTIQRVSTQKRLAMDIMSCGRDKVWVNPEKTAEIKEAKTSKHICHTITLMY